MVAVVYFTRPTSRRVTGAFTGGAAVGFFGMGAIVLGNTLGLWRVPLHPTPIFVVLFYLGLAISVTPIYLVTWRFARRFGWRGLAVFIGIVAIIDPPRDYLFAATFPLGWFSLWVLRPSSQTPRPMSASWPSGMA